MLNKNSLHQEHSLQWMITIFNCLIFHVLQRFK